MKRDRSKDEKPFNCLENNDHNYIAGLFNSKQQHNVRIFLTIGCIEKLFDNCTYYDVYELIEEHLGYAIPE